MSLTITQRALFVLALEPTSASMVGAVLWPFRKGKRGGVASTGGGDYPAQMLLGRLRKAGLVRTQHTEGSSVWELTPKGAQSIKGLCGSCGGPILSHGSCPECS